MRRVLVVSSFFGKRGWKGEEMERRRFLGAVTAASLGVALEGTFTEFGRAQSAARAKAGVPERAAKKSEFPENSTIVLVHAAWADGTCWSNIILPLERRGLKVICAPIPLTSLTNDATALSRSLERTSGPVVLVGHAYSGAPKMVPDSDGLVWMPEDAFRRALAQKASLDQAK